MKLYLYPKNDVMNNLSGNTAGSVTALLTSISGIFGMDNSDFNPVYSWFYFIVIGMVAFLMSFIAEAVQDEIKKHFDRVKEKAKKKNEIRLGNRHF